MSKPSFLPRWKSLRPLSSLVLAAAGLVPGLSARAAEPAFDIYEYVVDGNSLLSGLAIEDAVSPFLGERKTLADVEAARAALERRYHDAGFLTVVVAIPEQQVDVGAVALHVVEATVDRLRVKGAAYTLPSEIKDKVPELAEGRVPNFTVLQAQLAVANRSADTRVTPVLRAGALPGTVEVQLDIDDQLPFHGSVELSNRQTPNTTPQRLSASLRYDNLGQLGHSLAMTLQTAPQRTADASVLSLNYLVPYGSGGDALSLFYVHSRSDFASLGNSPGLGLLGNSDTLGLRNTWRLPAPSDSSQSFALGLDYRNVRQSLVVLGADSTDSPIVYVPVVASYTGALYGDDRSSSLDLNAAVGLRGLFGNSDAKFAAKRADASANFLALRALMQHTETLERWVLNGKLEAQIATGPLIPNDQFTAGGAESVRGYLEGERAGDAGLRASFELRTPPWAPAGSTAAWRLTGLGFLDLARVNTLHTEIKSLGGVGLGLRLTAPRGLSLEADAARALTDGDTTRSGDLRVHARALWSF